MGKKIVIVGGVAGGATAAARLRRLDETAEIVLFERGEYISYANCGLPYYIGGVIPQRKHLFVTTKESFGTRYAIDIRELNEVTSIDRLEKRVEVKNLRTGETYSESYDELILATGSSPFVPPLSGVDGENVFQLWTVPDTDKIFAKVNAEQTKSAVVVGGGFIGVELAENLIERGLKVVLVEKLPQIMAVYDQEMALILENELRARGVELFLGKGLAAIEEGGRRVLLDDGSVLDCDFVVLSIGTRVNSQLAKAAGLELNARGGVVVDEQMRTSDPSIFAVGDVIEVKDFNTGQRTMVPLAGPANKQGRIVADNIAAGRQTAYRGTQGTSILKLFDLNAACTGLNEAALQRMGKSYRRDYLVALLHPNAHAGYYPGAKPLTLKLIFDLQGKVLGAQIIGYDGVDKRIDVLATAIRFGATVYDLQDLELAYAPPFSSAKDPVNQLGYAAANQLEGLSDAVRVGELADLQSEDQLLDVREGEETAIGMIPGALHLPLSQLRQRLGELDRSKRYVVYCATGLRSYVAERQLKSAGFKAANLLGAYRSYCDSKPKPTSCGQSPERASGASDTGETLLPESGGSLSSEPPIELDACGLSCPGPIVSVSKAMKELADGERLRVLATDPGFARDIASWCENTGNRLLEQGKEGERYYALLAKGTLACGAHNPQDNLCVKEKTMIVFSGDLDKAIASFIIANGAAAMGNQVNLFFTFWGLNVLRKSQAVAVKKDFMSRMFGLMMPKGSQKLGLSRMNFGGAGAKMIRGVMKKKNIASLEDLIHEAQAAGVKLTACQMSMDVMGITKEELIDGVEIGGVAAMLNDNDHSNMNLFI